MTSTQYGRLPSYQKISEALSPIEAVGISYEDMKIHINGNGKLTVGVPKQLVIADQKDDAKRASLSYGRTSKLYPKIALLSFAEKLAEDGERQQIEDRNNPGSSVELSARSVVDFLSAIEEGKIELFPPPTGNEERRLSAVKEGIVNLGISRLGQ